MKKIFLQFNKNDKHKLKFLLDIFENLTYSFSKKRINIEIILGNSENDSFFLNLIKKKFKIKKIEEITKKNWVLKNLKEDKGIFTELFSISRGLNPKIKKSRFNLIIPAQMAFGTGEHQSTLLAIKNIEYIYKKEKFCRCFDLGTGSGILTLILKKLKCNLVLSSDIDINSKKIFYKNGKRNDINGLRFLFCNNFQDRVLRKKKFDLIVANLLLNSILKLCRDFYLSLSNGGIIIVSGILENQQQYVISIYRKFKFRLIKRKYFEGWVSIIFKKCNK